MESIRGLFPWLKSTNFSLTNSAFIGVSFRKHHAYENHSFPLSFDRLQNPYFWWCCTLPGGGLLGMLVDQPMKQTSFFFLCGSRTTAKDSPDCTPSVGSNVSVCGRWIGFNQAVEPRKKTKTALLSMKYWLVNGDLYNGLF